MRRTISSPTPLLAILGVLFLVAPAAYAVHVAPDFVAGNPSCADLGYGDFEFKIEPAPFSGTYDIDGFNTVTITTGDEVTFDWTSTLGMDAVIVKGGPNANVYVYNPESFGDTGLHSPINPNNDQPYGLSHISFCYDYEVTVSKDAETTFTRTFEWSIEKLVAPAQWHLFDGDSGTSQYTVAVQKTGYTDSDWAVSGTITIENATPFQATLTGVSDEISGGIAVAVDCGGIVFPYSLPSGQTLECTYAEPLPDGTNRVNTATVTTTGTVGGGEATAGVIFGNPTTLVNDTITVNDSNGSSWQFSDSGSQSYQRTFTCGGDEGMHDNVATIQETGQSDSASVSVACYALAVSKTAETSLRRTWVWDPQKVADVSELTLSPDQQYLVTYWVTVDATPTDSDWAVSGTISISNPHPSRAAQLTGVSDVVSPGIGGTVSCPALVVPAGGTLECTYSADLPDAGDRTNTATATLQNYAFTASGLAVISGTTDFSGQAAVGFGNAAVTHIDECVDLADDPYGPLGTVCAAQAPTTLHYSTYVGPFTAPDDCGENEVVNVVTSTTNDTGTSSSDSWTIVVTVPCQYGCTLTPGYWKTHSEHGPAPYDDTWAQLPSGADTLFFHSGQSYYEVLWTAPRGNAYYILGHAYIAAELNFLNGADPTDAWDAYQEATALLSDPANTPDYLGSLKGNKQPRKRFIELAGVLDFYNNGDLGPGHCSEE